MAVIRWFAARASWGLQEARGHTSGTTKLEVMRQSDQSWMPCIRQGRAHGYGNSLRYRAVLQTKCCMCHSFEAHTTLWSLRDDIVHATNMDDASLTNGRLNVGCVGWMRCWEHTKIYLYTSYLCNNSFIYVTYGVYMRVIFYHVQNVWSMFCFAAERTGSWMTLLTNDLHNCNRYVERCTWWNVLQLTHAETRPRIPMSNDAPDVTISRQVWWLGGAWYASISKDGCLQGGFDNILLTWEWAKM